MPDEEREPTVEERQRWTAEARKFEAEADLANATRIKMDGEARTALASADITEMTRDVAARTYREEMARNKYHHVYHFTDSVSASSVRACMDQLTVWMRTADDEEKQPITIVFSSPGGSVVEGMALWDYIQQVRRAGHHVTTHTIGYAASMAGILLQAGDVRTMGAEAYILVHEVSAAAVGKIGEMEDEMKFLKMISSRVLDIFAARTKLTKRQLDARWRRKDWWLSSSDALKLGFVDEVI